jgi:hypothetical protein
MSFIWPLSLFKFSFSTFLASIIFYYFKCFNKNKVIKLTKTRPENLKVCASVMNVTICWIQESNRLAIVTFFNLNVNFATELKKLLREVKLKTVFTGLTILRKLKICRLTLSVWKTLHWPEEKIFFASGATTRKQSHLPKWPKRNWT